MCNYLTNQNSVQVCRIGISGRFHPKAAPKIAAQSKSESTPAIAPATRAHLLPHGPTRQSQISSPKSRHAFWVLKPSPALPQHSFPSCIITSTHHNHHPPHPQQHLHHQPRWPAPSRPPVSPLVARLPASSLPPRPLASPHRLPVVSRSLTATSPVPSLSVRSVATRRALSFSSASCPSSAWYVPLHQHRRHQQPLTNITGS